MSSTSIAIDYLLTVIRFPDMFDTVGIAKSSGVVTALLMGVSFIPTVILQWRGSKWRST